MPSHKRGAGVGVPGDERRLNRAVVQHATGKSPIAPPHLAVVTVDHAAMAAIFLAYVDRLLRLAIRRVGRAHTADAEDAVSEVFVTLWTQRRAGQGPAPGEEGPYLFGALRRCIANHRRDRWGSVAADRHLELFDAGDDGPESLIDPSEDAGAALEADDRRGRVMAEIDRLPERARQLVLLRLEGLPFADIAAAQGVPSSSARREHADAIAFLRTRLAPALDRASPRVAREGPKGTGRLPR